MQNKRKFVIGIVAAALVVGSIYWWKQAPAAVPKEMLRSELELVDGRMRPKSGGEPFSGIMFERASTGTRLSEISLQDGIVHGLARGWYDAGQLEVEETFVNGKSNGIRKRWHANGQKKSEVTIVEGELNGSYTEWHDNGQLAVMLTMVHGKAHGLSEAWHADGSRKAVVTMDAGTPVKQEFFPKPTTEVADQ